MELNGLIGGAQRARGDGRSPGREATGTSRAVEFRGALGDAGQAAAPSGSPEAGGHAGAGRATAEGRAPPPRNFRDCQPADPAEAPAGITLLPAAWLMRATEAAGGANLPRTTAAQLLPSAVPALQSAAVLADPAVPAAEVALAAAQVLPQAIALGPPGAGAASATAASPIFASPVGADIEGAAIGPAAAGATLPPGTESVPAAAAPAASARARDGGESAAGQVLATAGERAAARPGSEAGNVSFSPPGLRVAAMRMTPGGFHADAAAIANGPGGDARGSNAGPESRPVPVPPAVGRLPLALGSAAPLPATGAATPVRRNLPGPQAAAGGGLTEFAGIGALPPGAGSQPAPPAAPATAAPYFAGGAETMRAVAPQITAAIVSDPGAGRIELRLDPPELGQVEIAIDIVEQSLRATLTVERPATHELFRRHGEALLAQLQQAGFTAVDLRFAGEESPHPRPGWATAGSTHPGPSGRPEAMIATPGIARAVATGRQAEGLDLRL